MSVDSNVHSGFDDEDSDGFHPHRPRRRFTMQEYDRALESGAIRDTSYKSQDPIEQRPPLVRKTGIRVAQISDEAYTSEEDLSDEVPVVKSRILQVGNIRANFQLVPRKAFLTRLICLDHNTLHLNENSNQHRTFQKLQERQQILHIITMVMLLQCCYQQNLLQMGRIRSYHITRRHRHRHNLLQMVQIRLYHMLYLHRLQVTNLHLDRRTSQEMIQY
jgi:hypothetical protein